MSVDFYSIDKLVEFGLTNEVATQMVNSLNNTFRQMQMPGVNLTGTSKKEDLYYAMIDGKQEGPLALTEVIRLIAERRIVKSTLLWKPEMSNWTPAGNIEDVLNVLAITPPPISKEYDE